MSYSTECLKLANELQITIDEARGIEVIYDLLCGFGFVKNVEELRHIGTLKRGSDQIEPLPQILFDFIVDNYLKKGKTTVDSFSPMLKSEKIVPFGNWIIKKKIQPKRYWYEGVLVISTTPVSGGYRYAPVEYEERSFDESN